MYFLLVIHFKTEEIGRRCGDFATKYGHKFCNNCAAFYEFASPTHTGTHAASHTTVAGSHDTSGPALNNI